METPSTPEANLGDSYIDCRLLEKTKKIYKGKLAQFTLWAKNEVKFEDLTATVLKDFIADASLKRDKKAETVENPFVFVIPHKMQSYENVSGYKSAIISEYKTRGMTVPDPVILMFAQLFAGLKRKVGELKLNGEMPMQEGKQPITFDGVKFISKESTKATTDCW